MARDYEEERRRRLQRAMMMMEQRQQHANAKAKMLEKEQRERDFARREKWGTKAQQGAMAGSAYGPYGAIIGGAVGGMSGKIDAFKARSEQGKDTAGNIFETFLNPISEIENLAVPSAEGAQTTGNLATDYERRKGETQTAQADAQADTTQMSRQIAAQEAHEKRKKKDEDEQKEKEQFAFSREYR